MTLDINKNNSFFNDQNKKDKKKKKNDDSESEKQEHENSDNSQKVYHQKRVDASSLEVLGMQNALMIHQESIVHKHYNNDNKTKDAPNDKQNSNEQTNKNGIFLNEENCEKLGITQNEDGTFSIKNNPFGKFTKATIEDYINKYIIPSLSDAWINGYSKLYTINSKKVLLMKITAKDGSKVYKGRIIENGEKFIIYYGVKENEQPDENNIIKKVKVTPPTNQ